MLYILDLHVQHTNKVNVLYDNEATGSLQYVNLSKQTKIVDAANESEAQQKVQSYYDNLNTETDSYEIIVLSISDTII